MKSTQVFKEVAAMVVKRSLPWKLPGPRDWAVGPTSVVLAFFVVGAGLE